MKLEIMQKKKKQLKVSKKGGKVIKQQQKPTNYKTNKLQQRGTK